MSVHYQGGPIPEAVSVQFKNRVRQWTKTTEAALRVHRRPGAGGDTSVIFLGLFRQHVSVMENLVDSIRAIVGTLFLHLRNAINHCLGRIGPPLRP